MSPITCEHALGSLLWAQVSEATGRVAECRVPRRGTKQGVTGMLPPTLPARLETSEGQEQMDGFGGGQGGGEVRRERKQSKGNKIRTALQQCTISLQHKTNLPQVFVWTWQLCK